MGTHYANPAPLVDLVDHRLGAIEAQGARPLRGMRILAPDGLVLGLKIDNGEMFERLLQEDTVALSPGDLFVLFTDGMSEAMNSADECFGETRLGELVMEHLQKLDQVAYVRFASVYRKFKDVTEFMDELKGLSGEEE